MRRLALFVGLALVVSGCSGGSIDVTAPPPPVTPAPIDQPPTTTTTSTPPSVTVPPDTTSSQWSPRETLTLPEGVTAERVARLDGRTVALGVTRAGGEFNIMGFWATADGTGWTEVMLSELIDRAQVWELPVVTDLVVFKGRFYAFLMGDERDAAELAATFLVSSDGVDWSLERMDGAVVGALVPGRYATPESPPWPGLSAVSDATVTGDELVAVGWTLIGERSSPIVWRTSDGSKWTSSVLSNQQTDREWAGRVAVGDLGYLVEGGGPYYTASYVWFSADGTTWKPVTTGTEGEIVYGPLALAPDRALMMSLSGFDRGNPIRTVWDSPDGRTWESAGELPVIDEALVSLWWDGTGFLFAGETVQSSPDGRTWTTEIEQSGTYAPLAGTRDIVNLSGGAIEVWARTVAAETFSVVLVSHDDVLNGRAEAGVQAGILVEISPDARGLAATGATEQVEAALWRQLNIDGTLVWVNDFYLTPDLVPAEADMLEAVERLAGSFLGQSDLGAITSSRGLLATRYGPLYRFAGLDLAIALDDPTTYEWGSPACSPDECPNQLTFTDGVAAPFLSAWDDSDRQVAFNEPILGGNGSLAATVVPFEFAGFPYVAIHDPGDDPAYGGIDWQTWYVYLSVEAGTVRVVGMSIDMWAP